MYRFSKSFYHHQTHAIKVKKKPARILLFAILGECGNNGMHTIYVEGGAEITLAKVEKSIPP